MVAGLEGQIAGDRVGGGRKIIKRKDVWRRGGRRSRRGRRAVHDLKPNVRIPVTQHGIGFCWKQASSAQCSNEISLNWQCILCSNGYNAHMHILNLHHLFLIQGYKVFLHFPLPPPFLLSKGTRRFYISPSHLPSFFPFNPMPAIPIRFWAHLVLLSSHLSNREL
jgi:hypothetical protein